MRASIVPAALAILALAGLLAGAGIASGAEAEAWKEYRSVEGGFAVLFPGTPKIQTEPASAGGVASHEYLATLGKEAFVVSYDDYPPGNLAVENQEHVFDLARDRLVKNQPVTLLVDKPVHAGDHRGREVVFREQDGYIQFYRIYVSKDRLYQTITGGPPGSENNPDVARFHGSFRFIQ